jgi:hypothetical protein
MVDGSNPMWITSYMNITLVHQPPTYPILLYF